MNIGSSGGIDIDQLFQNATNGLSQDGQALLRMLSAGDQGASLQRAAQSAAKGNPAEMMRMMNQVMKSPAGAELVQRINQSIKGK